MTNKIGLKEELMFWNQIFGDHSRFIFDNLSPKEITALREAQSFIEIFDKQLALARNTADNWQCLAPILYQTNLTMLQLRNFKLRLLALHLENKIVLGLTPTFINHMLNELERGYNILAIYHNFVSPPVKINPISLHLLWLLDAIGHAGAVYCDLDYTQADLRKTMEKFQKLFEKLYLSSNEFAGFTRAKQGLFPSLQRFNKLTAMKITSFMNLLERIKVETLQARVIGSIQPLVADHMAREECYYLLKLHLADPANVPDPHCLPWRPRVS